VNRRHHAAIVFVGWYLIVPPPLMPKYAGQREPDPQAALSQWEQLGEFKDAVECERERTNLENQLLDPKMMASESQQRGWYGDYARKRLSYSKCIEADDPRLKSE
jgi:hypothetical protein